MNLTDALGQQCKEPIRIQSKTPALCAAFADPTRKNALPYRGFRKENLAMILSLLTLILCSCGYIETSPPKLVATPVTREKPIILAHQPYRVVEIWLSTMNSYTRTYFDQAKQQIATAIDAAVQPNSDGMLIMISLISSNSFKPEATVLTIRIPSLDADPQSPVLLPVPTPTNDPFADAKAAKQVAAENAARQQHYQQVLREHHTHLAAVRNNIHRLTDQLRHLNSPVDSGTQDLWGAFGRAAKRFQGVHAKKLFLLVTSLDQTSWEQFSPDLYLPQVSVSVIYAYCAQTQPVCEQSTGFWKGAFEHANASSISITDPAQSATLSLFS